MSRKRKQKKLKYSISCIELQLIWNMKCMITPLIIGATGTVTKGLKKNLETILREYSTNSLQKTATLGTSHIIRKVLQCETGRLSGGDHCWFRRSTRERRLVTRVVVVVVTINEMRTVTQKRKAFNT